MTESIGPKVKRLENFLTDPESPESTNYISDFLEGKMARPEESFVHKFLDDPFWEELGYNKDTEIKHEDKSFKGRVEGGLHIEGKKIAIECKKPYLKSKEIEKISKLKGDDIKQLEKQIGRYLKTHDYVIYTNGFHWFFYSKESYDIWQENNDKADNPFKPFFKEIIAEDLFSKESPDYILNILSKKNILESFLSMEKKIIRRELTNKFFTDLKNWIAYLDEALATSNTSNEYVKDRATSLINKLIFLRTMEAVDIIRSEYVADNWAAKSGVNTSVKIFIDQLDNDFSKTYNTELFLPQFVEDSSGKPKVVNGDYVPNPDRKHNMAYEQLSNDFFSAILRPLDKKNPNDSGMRKLRLNGKEFNVRSLYYWKFDKIDADILGKAYETYLALERKKLGIYYTPHEMAEFLTEKSVTQIFDEKFSKLKHEFEKEVWDTKKISCIGNEIIDIKICDPSCGSGSFLIQAIRTIWKKYQELAELVKIIDDKIAKNKSTLDPQSSPENKVLRDFFQDVLKIDDKQQKMGSIILRHIYGNDKDPKAVSTAKLNIWLECLRLDPNTFKLESLEGKVHALPNLGLNITTGDSLVDLDVDDLDQSLTKEDRMTIHALFGLRRNYSVHLESTNDINDAITMRDEFVSNIIDEKFDEKFDEKEGEDIRKITKPTYWQIQHFEAFYNIDGKLKNKEERGFDVIVGNPPWEILEPDVDEFFGPIYDEENLGKFSKLKSKKKGVQNELLRKPNVELKWKKYNEQIELQQRYYRKLKLYKHQGGSTSQNKIRPDFYKLFVEKYYLLLKKEGVAGIVLPANFNTNQGVKNLRKLIFDENEIILMFGFSNEKGIFDIHRQKKFINLIFKKGGKTSTFKSAFKIKDVENIQYFEKNAVIYDLDLVLKTSPDNLTISETENQKDVDMLNKLFEFPLLSADSDWKIHYQREFNKSDDKKLFNIVEIGSPLYSGKNIHQYDHKFSVPEYWIDTKKGRDELNKRQTNRTKIELKKNAKKDTEIKLPKIEIDFDHFRLSWREVTSETNTRTVICTILPPNIFSEYTLPYLRPNYFNGKDFEKAIDSATMLFLCGMFNSFVIDYILRQRISIHATMAHMKEIPIPRYSSGDPYFTEIVETVGSLICTTNEFDVLKKELKIKKVVTEAEDRLDAQAKINAYVAKIYDLSREDLEYILGTFSKKNDNLKLKTQQEFERLP